MSQLFPTASRTAFDRFTRDLSRVYTSRAWQEDPSYALSTDEQIYERVQRDPVVAHAAQQRKHLVAGPGFRVEARNDSETAQRAASVLEELLDQWRTQASDLDGLAEAIFRGSSWARVDGREEPLDLAGLGRRRWWVPTRLRDVDRRRFRRGLVDGAPRWHLWSVERAAWEPLEDRRHWVSHAYRDTEERLGYGRGLLDALYFFLSVKMRVLQEGAAAVERFGQGFFTVGVESMRQASTARGTDDVVARYLSELQKNRGRHFFAYDAADKLEILKGGGEGWQLVREMLAYLDNAIRVLILGSNLPTSATAGGSFALAEVQENSTEALIQFDRRLLAETLNRDLVPLVWSLNATTLAEVGLAGEPAPFVTATQEKREDPQAVAGIVATLLGAGVRLRSDEVYERTGFTQPRDGDKVLEPPAAPAPGGDPLAGLLGGAL